MESGGDGKVGSWGVHAGDGVPRTGVSATLGDCRGDCTGTSWWVERFTKSGGSSGVVA